MTTIERIRELTDRTRFELARGSDYYTHTQTAWRSLEDLATTGQAVRSDNEDTGTRVDGPRLVELSREYLSSYLTESVFQVYVTLFEDYVFGLIGLWLMAHPKGILGLDEDDGDGRLKGTDKAIPLAIITDNPDRESILRAVVDRELDRLRYRRLASWFDYLDQRARLGVPTKEQVEKLAEIKASRDILAHNGGVINRTYLAKSGGRARYREGARLDITEPYLRESWRLIFEVVDGTSAAAIAKLG